MIRVVLPPHLRLLAQVDSEVMVHVDGPVTQRSILDALEAGYPTLRGTIREYETLRRRPLVRFFACEEDVSHDSPDAPLVEVQKTAPPLSIPHPVRPLQQNRR
jgi:sulfur-carrier protein